MGSPSGSGGARRSSSSSLPPPLEEGALRCPRCDSPNTKFCYYNNYSLTQPRHYCKACRRYWTRGGALRNVPVGGGCRKNKKTKFSSLPSSSSSSYSMSQNPEIITHPFKFFQGFSSDFHVGDRFNNNINNMGSNQFLSYGDLSAISSDGTGASGITANASTSLMGMINYPTENFSELPLNNCDSQRRIASTIESLSSINQDLHWKLQQQRVAMMYGGDHHRHHQKDDNMIVSDIPNPYVQNQTLPISYQMPFSSDSMASLSGTAPRSNFSCVGDGMSSSSGWYLDETSRNPVGVCTDMIKTWKDIHQFSALP